MKRRVLEQLKRDELIAAVERLELPVADRRRRDLLIEALMSSQQAPLAEILADLKRDRLKEVCRALDLDDGGREKSAVVQRLAGGWSRPADAVATPSPVPRSEPAQPEHASASVKPPSAPAWPRPDQAPSAEPRRGFGDPAAGRRGPPPAREGAGKPPWARPRPDRAPSGGRRRRAPGPPRGKPMNIQDGFLFECLKEGRHLHFTLVTGQDIEGRIQRFDQYAILVATGTRQILLYKHVISDVSAV